MCENLCLSVEFLLSSDYLLRSEDRKRRNFYFHARMVSILKITTSSSHLKNKYYICMFSLFINCLLFFHLSFIGSFNFVFIALDTCNESLESLYVNKLFYVTIGVKYPPLKTFKLNYYSLKKFTIKFSFF
ncbi:hypothetical protein BpHYR1_015769 [Brachionus plicatilis]|uniref:Uncharacterized protein n=1 Tax=Brachionus plicatilis TaxID=10195 RepID=A0A3M7QA60_BRAPC|nr:hypothetical protein BpHYR1_015769 [Brachionus plicatilis]